MSSIKEVVAVVPREEESCGVEYAMGAILRIAPGLEKECGTMRIDVDLLAFFMVSPSPYLPFLPPVSYLCIADSVELFVILREDYAGKCRSVGAHRPMAGIRINCVWDRKSVV